MNASAWETVTFYGLLVVVLFGSGCWVGATFSKAAVVLRQSRDDRPDYAFSYGPNGEELSGSYPALRLVEDK